MVPQAGFGLRRVEPRTYRLVAIDAWQDSNTFVLLPRSLASSENSIWLGAGPKQEFHRNACQ